MADITPHIDQQFSVSDNLYTREQVVSGSTGEVLCLRDAAAIREGLRASVDQEALQWVEEARRKRRAELKGTTLGR